MNKRAYILLLIFLFLFSSCTWFSPESVDSTIKKPQFSGVLNTFVVYGDTRDGHDAHKEVVSKILSTEPPPSIVFHTGDLVGNGNDASQWNTFNAITAVMRAKIPFYSVAGNHERESRLYYDNFDYPGNERWYSVSRPGIDFILLDTNLNIDSDSAQYKWLVSELDKADSEDVFKVVIFHHPPFSTCGHSNDEKDIQGKLIPLLVEHNVALVFNGHSHCYERFLVEGIQYIVTGGGGAPLYPLAYGEQAKNRVVGVRTYHYCVISLFSDRLVVSVNDYKGEVLDVFSVTK